MLKTILPYLHKPDLYAPGNAALWTDPHISKGMLNAHLDPLWDSATRSHAFVDRSVDWIERVAPPDRYPSLLDLGCGPGLYAERLARKGYRVTGLDFSQRSIAYARQSAEAQGLSITYLLDDYLGLFADASYDLITLINYDFGVLSTENRQCLLGRIYRALRPGGLLMLDVFTPEHYAGQQERRAWEFAENGGFFSPDPYLCLHTLYRYDAENTFLRQHLIVTETKTLCHHIWEHTFTPEELQADLRQEGLTLSQLAGDIAGAALGEHPTQFAAIASKAR